MKRKIPIKPGVLITLNIHGSIIPKRILSYALPGPRGRERERTVKLQDLRPGGSTTWWSEDYIHEVGKIMDELGYVLYVKD